MEEKRNLPRGEWEGRHSPGERNFDPRRSRSRHRSRGKRSTLGQHTRPEDDHPRLRGDGKGGIPVLRGETPLKEHEMKGADENGGEENRHHLSKEQTHEKGEVCQRRPCERHHWENPRKRKRREQAGPAGMEHAGESEQRKEENASTTEWRSCHREK